MPQLIKLYIRNVAIGFGLAGVFVALLLAFNVQNLWSLISGSDVAVLAVLLLWIMNGIVFAGVQFGWAVMSMAEKDDDSPRGGSPLVHDFNAVPVRVDDKRQPTQRNLPRY